MQLHLKRPLVVFDLETTGLDIVRDRIIQLAYIKVYPDGHEERGNYLVNPEREIPAEVVKITGISQADVSSKPTFRDMSKMLEEVFLGCDFAGFNSNHFDIPLLAEEFLRCGIDFDFSKCALIDMQTIFHKMEPRNLTAAYKFYCGKELVGAHKADNDTEATYQVLLGQLEMYSSERQKEESRCLPNDMEQLAAYSKTNDNVDFAGRIVWKPVTGKDGQPVYDAKGEPKRHEVFNFGKYKGWDVLEALHRDPGYFGWMMNGDFPQNTKQALTRIKLRDFNKR